MFEFEYTVEYSSHCIQSLPLSHSTVWYPKGTVCGKEVIWQNQDWMISAAGARYLVGSISRWAFQRCTGRWVLGGNFNPSFSPKRMYTCTVRYKLTVTIQTEHNLGTALDQHITTIMHDDDPNPARPRGTVFEFCARARDANRARFKSDGRRKSR